MFTRVGLEPPELKGKRKRQNVGLIFVAYRALFALLLGIFILHMSLPTETPALQEDSVFC